MFEPIYKNLSLSDMEGEEWVYVVGYNGNYMISNMGRVKTVARRYGNNRFQPECILRQSFNKKGYLQICLNKDAKRNTGRIHRLVATHFIDNPENKPEVNHKKGIKIDNRASELEWATAKENVKHAFRMGLKSMKGEKNSFSIVSEKTVLAIRSEYIKGKYGQRQELSDKYGITKNHVKLITLNRSWRHLL